jgi:c-di-GMP-binding flagellar brake protein YcgR
MMSGQHGFPIQKADTPHGTERRRSPRYRFSEAMAVQCPGGTLMTGISVEISQGGMSAMVNGLLQVGDSAEVYPVAGAPVQARVRHKLGLLYGFEFTEISAAQIRQIAENWKKSYACRLRARNT